VQSYLNVSEIFRSMQGEGPNAGKIAVFLRLAGCNLKCPWCDTKYARKGQKMSVGDVLEGVLTLAGSCKFIVITGGEPLLQQESLRDLLHGLKHLDFEIEMETNGTIVPAAGFMGRVNYWSVSPKVFDSVPNNEVIEFFVAASEMNFITFKFVVATEMDVERVKQLCCLKFIPLEDVRLMAKDTPKTTLERQKWLVDVCVKNGINFSSRLQNIFWKAGRRR
jgi:7-carboxy-7-deazaguanine synthase